MSNENFSSVSTDQMGRPRLVKSYAELCKETFGSAFNLDQYTQDLVKALSTTTSTALGSSNVSGLTAIALQNLDATMTSVLFEEQHLAMFNFMSKVPSLTTYYEWNRRNRYGTGRANAGFAEGLAPWGGSAQFTRTGSYIRYMGVRRSITHPMMLTGQLGGAQIDPVEEENRDGTLELLERIERNLVFGDTNISDGGGRQVNYDGLLSYMTKNYAGNVIDMLGQPFSFESVENLGYNLFQAAKLRNFSEVRAFMNGQVLADLSKLKFQADRRDITDGAASYFTGLPLSGHRTNFGVIPFEPSIFMEDVDGGTPLTVSDPGYSVGSSSGSVPASIPLADITVAAAAAPTGTTSNVPAGSYYYAVAPAGDVGEGARTLVTTPVAVAAGQAVSVTTSGYADTNCTFFRVYRGTKSDGSDLQWVARIPAYATGAALTAFTGLPYSNSAGVVSNPGGNLKFFDINWWNPTAKGLVVAFDRRPDNLAIAQMSPLLRWPLPINSTSVEWLLLLYHTLAIKAPERVYIYKNVGTIS